MSHTYYNVVKCNMEYVSRKKALQYFGVSPNTLKSWADTGKIDFRVSKGGKRYYNIGDREQTSTGKKIIYARVSSSKQRDDLERQVNYLLEKYPGYEVIKDIGSGINFKRKGLLTILQEGKRGNIQEVVIASRDRLCRFAFELFEWIFGEYNIKLTIHFNEDQSPEQELSDDLMSIVQVFCCKRNGKRRYSDKNKKDKIETDSSTEKDSSEME